MEETVLGRHSEGVAGLGMTSRDMMADLGNSSR